VQTVTLSTTTPGAAIRYTIDGSTPTETAGTVYSGPVAVNSSGTIRAIAYESADVERGGPGRLHNQPAAAARGDFDRAG